MTTDFEKAFLTQKDDKQAKHLSQFFKTGKGQYGENDVFLGLKVGQTRTIVKEFWQKYSIPETANFLKNPYHEIRLGALLMLIKKYENAEIGNKKEIYETYIKNVEYVNNWDLVDMTAPQIVGDYVFNFGSTDDLWKLANSSNLWSQRVSIVASWYFIKRGKYNYTLDICEKFFTHDHDLIHKATGWMLREVGKKDEKTLCDFLDKNACYMPRTSLRYAIERFEETKRKAYLGIKKIN